MAEFDINGTLETHKLIAPNILLSALGEGALALVQGITPVEEQLFSRTYSTRTRTWTAEDQSNCRLNVREQGPASLTVVTAAIDAFEGSRPYAVYLFQPELWARLDNGAESRVGLVAVHDEILGSDPHPADSADFSALEDIIVAEIAAGNARPDFIDLLDMDSAMFLNPQLPRPRKSIE